MAWETTITKKGLEVLAGLDNNHISISAVMSGVGTVPLGELNASQKLLNPKQNLLLIEDGKIGNKRILRLQALNKGLTEGYCLNQLGIFIKVDGGEPILYFIAQNEDGDLIPSETAVADFIAEYVVTLIFSTDAEITTELSQMPYVTTDALNSKISLLLGIVPIDGGTFFDEYEPFVADGGVF